jgi:predicted acetyltransferase
MPHLVLPTDACRESFLGAVQEFAAEGQPLFRDREITAGTFGGLLRLLADARAGRNLPEGIVPATDLWLVEAEEWLGFVSIRHRLTPSLARIGGHIGYRIRPSARRQGYGRLILRLALPHAHRLGINPALVTCDADNIASRKIIEASGGLLENQIEQEGHSPKLRFWVPTGP